MDLHELVTQAGDAAFAMGLDGRIAHWNDAAAALLGHPRAEVLGRRCWDVLAGSDGRGERVCWEDCPVMRRARAGESPAAFDLRARTKAGRIVSLGVSTLSVGAGSTDGALVIHLIREIVAPPVRVTSTLPTPSAAPDPGTQPLTRRELEVLSLTREGSSTRVIAERLRVSAATVRNHTQSILRKLEVHSRLEAVAVATRHRLLP